jgi:MFS family permease
MSSSEKSSPPALWPVILITALFFFWGMANNLNDILIPQFKKAFVLTDFESSLVQQAFYAGYFIMAIPAGLLMRRFGYKAAVVTGLVIFAIGAFSFWPGATAVADHLFAAFGAERLMWGSDWPVVDLAGGYSLWLDWTRRWLDNKQSSTRDAILSRNARTFYRLD